MKGNTPIDHEYENRKFEVVNVFKYRGRVCIIVKVHWDIFGYQMYNGYVSLRKHRFWNRGKYEKSYTKYMGLAPDELSYEGYFEKEWRAHDSKNVWLDHIPDDLYFFGFDTGHAWNNAENASQEAVLHKTLILADRMIKRRV